MKVALCGGTGQAGSRILKELLDRGHTVTALVRDPAKVTTQQRLTVVKGDVTDESSIADASRGADALVSAYGPGPEHPELLVPATRHLRRRPRLAECRDSCLWAAQGHWKLRPGSR